MTANELATDCLPYLEPINGTEPGEHRYTQLDTAPDWFADLVRAAHFGLLPNDWSYRFVRDSLLLCENCDEDGPQVDVDSEYPYTRDRLNWFASSLDRPGYCDEYADETGERAPDVLTAVAQGMWLEMDKVARLVWETLCDQTAERE